MQPENPLFNHEQFGAAVNQQEQRESLNRSAEAVVNACREGTVVQPISDQNYSQVFVNYRYGREAESVADVQTVYKSMFGYQGASLRFADTPHDEFEWQGMIAGESRFAVFELYNQAVNQEQAYDVLRLLNTPKEHVAVPDERGLYIALPRNGGDTVMFKMIDNPNNQQSVTKGESLVDDNDRPLVRQVITDPRPFIPQALTTEETLAATGELELAAQAYQTASAE